MGVEATHIVIVGQLFNLEDFNKLSEDKLGDDVYEKVYEPYRIHAFSSYRSKDTDGNLKCVEDDKYVIYGHLVQIAYGDDGEGLDLLTLTDEKIRFYKEQAAMLFKESAVSKLLGLTEFYPQVHILTYYT